MNHDVFISYSSKEKSIADGVCHYLEANGVKCWMAPRDIPAGTDYGDLIDEAIKSCRVVVLVYSQYSFLSKWVKGEINVAFDEGKPIAPFRIDETAIKGAFRVMLQQLHWIDAFPSYSDRLPDLLQSICGILGRPVSESNVKQSVQEESFFVANAMPEQPAVAEIHIEVDTDCRIYRFHNEIMFAHKGEDNVLMLQKGNHKLLFVAEENPELKAERVVKITDTNFSDFIEVTLVGENKSEKPALAAKATKVMGDALKVGVASLAAVPPALAVGVAAGAAIVSATSQDMQESPTATPNMEQTEEERQKITEAREQRSRERSAQKAEKIEKAKDKERMEVNPGYVLVGQELTELGKKDVAEFREKENIQVANSVVKINSKAFENIAVLKNIILPRRLKRIGEYAFWGCSALEKIEIPASVAEINSYAFLDCCGLKELVFADNATIVKIGQGAFSGCKQLEKVVIPISVGEVDVEAFWKCDNLKEVILRNPNTEYKKYHGFLLKPSFPKHTKIIIG